MSESKPDYLGDPDCICQGTGLVCRLGPDSRPDPESIAVCDCVPVKARADERKRLEEGLRKLPRYEAEMEHWGGPLAGGVLAMPQEAPDGSMLDRDEVLAALASLSSNSETEEE